MKKISCIIISFVIAIGAQSQSSNLRNNMPNHYADVKYKKLKTAGIVLSSAGVACEVAAISIYSKAVRERKKHVGIYHPKDLSANEVVGKLGIYGGGLALVSGITTFLIAGTKLKKWKQFSVNASDNTLQFNYSF